MNDKTLDLVVEALRKRKPCTCVRCWPCRGSGLAWDHDANYGLGDFERCEECDGSGLTEVCDACEEYEEMERDER